MSILRAIQAETARTRDAVEAVAAEAARHMPRRDALAELTREFPDYEFTRRDHWDGPRIHAVARAGAAGPRIYAAVGRTPREMRIALREAA